MNSENIEFQETKYKDENNSNDSDDKTTDTMEEKETTYLNSRVIELESQLEDARSDLKLILHYLKTTDQKFISYQGDEPISHESIVEFVEKNTIENEVTDKRCEDEKIQ